MNIDFAKNMNILDVSSNYNNGKQNIFQTSVSYILNLVDVETNYENDDRELHKKKVFNYFLIAALN